MIPTSTGDPLLDQGLQTLKDVFKIKLDPGTVTGLLDPAIDKLAKDHVATVRKWLKPGNPLLHPLMNYGLGALSGRIDEVAGKKAEPLRTTMRKFSDYVDSFRGELFGKDTGEHGDMKAAREAVVALSPEDVVWLKKIDDLLALADTPEKMANLKEYSKDAGGVRFEAKQMVLHGPEKKQEPEKPKVPLKERLAGVAQTVDEAVDAALTPVNNELEQWLAKWEMSNQTRRQKIRAKVVPQKSSRLGKFLRWLTKP